MNALQGVTPDQVEVQKKKLANEKDVLCMLQRLPGESPEDSARFLRSKFIVKYGGKTIEDNEVRQLKLEYIAGKQLSVAIKDGTVNSGNKNRIALEIARGLKYMHSHNVAHHDFHPGNVMITEIGQKVKITDFGDAKASASAEDKALDMVYFAGILESLYPLDPKTRKRQGVIQNIIDQCHGKLTAEDICNGKYF
ncbi:hypothetical protein BGX31_003239, partial [Mortierella sp. GBA43]